MHGEDRLIIEDTNKETSVLSLDNVTCYKFSWKISFLISLKLKLQSGFCVDSIKIGRGYFRLKMPFSGNSNIHFQRVCLNISGMVIFLLLYYFFTCFIAISPQYVLLWYCVTHNCLCRNSNILYFRSLS